LKRGVPFLLKPDKLDGCLSELNVPGFLSMDPAEIKRLRRAIQRTYGSSPHKKKVWMALLERQANLHDRTSPQKSATAQNLVHSLTPSPQHDQ
jgi:hypothetical protein